MDLTFTPGVNSLTVSVPIIDNGILEDTEQFFGDLSTSDPDVDLRPQRTTIRIADDDGKFLFSIHCDSSLSLSHMSVVFAKAKCFQIHVL